MDDKGVYKWPTCRYTSAYAGPVGIPTNRSSERCGPRCAKWFLEEIISSRKINEHKTFVNRPRIEMLKPHFRPFVSISKLMVKNVVQV